MKTFLLCLSVLLMSLHFSNQMKLLPDTDLPGGDYTSFSTTGLSYCTNACGNDTRCKAFTFNPRTNLCWLKSTVNPPSNSPGATSGIKYY